VALAQPTGKFSLQSHAKSPAWQIGDDRLPDAGHVVGEGRAQRIADDVDRPFGNMRAQQFDD
jgi:hypothetical protein